MPDHRFARFIFLGVTVLFAATLHAATINPVAPHTIFLTFGTDTNAPMTVAYHPGFNRYYASGGNSPSIPAYAYDAAGTLVQTQSPINVDPRGWNYNPNTNMLEVVSYNAVNSGSPYALTQAQTDGSGNLTGGIASLLASMPGLPDDQTMPIYDPAANVFYARAGSNVVNVVSRTNGALLSTINLDFGTAGVSNTDIVSEAVGYEPNGPWLVVVDKTNDRALIYSMTGTYLGASQLDIVSYYGGGNTGWATRTTSCSSTTAVCTDGRASPSRRPPPRQLRRCRQSPARRSRRCSACSLSSA